jgi:hypothetical protein
MKTTIDNEITAALNIDDKGLVELYDLLKSYEASAEPRTPLSFTIDHIGGEKTTVEDRSELGGIPNTLARRVIAITGRVDYGSVAVQINPTYNDRYFMRYEVTGEPELVTMRVKQIRDWIERHETSYTWASSQKLTRTINAAGLALVALINIVLVFKYHASGKTLLVYLLVVMVLIVPYFAFGATIQRSLFPKTVFTFNGGEQFFAKAADRRKNFGWPLLVGVVILVLSLLLPFLWQK